MFRTIILLVILSSIAARQTNINLSGLLDKRFLSAAIFGDSTSDTGNVFDLTSGTWPICPPNYKGRFSNGLNWADDLPVFVKYNYAYGSATTDNNFVNGYTKANTVPVPGLLQQVQEYLNDTTLSLFRHKIVPIIWGGANDPIANPALALRPDLVVGSLMKSAKALLAGNVTNLIVFNQEPFEIVPINAALNQSAQFIQLTAVVNTLTNASLQQMKAAYPNTQIYLFDLHSLIAKLYANPPKPIKYTTGYCWAVVGTTIPNYCKNPTNYFFADTFHFTTPVQRKIGEAVGKFFEKDFAPRAENYFYAI